MVSLDTSEHRNICCDFFFCFLQDVAIFKKKGSGPKRKYFMLSLPVFSLGFLIGFPTRLPAGSLVFHFNYLTHPFCCTQIKNV